MATMRVATAAAAVKAKAVAKARENVEKVKVARAKAKVRAKVMAKVAATTAVVIKAEVDLNAPAVKAVLNELQKLPAQVVALCAVAGISLQNAQRRSPANVPGNKLASTTKSK